MKIKVLKPFKDFKENVKREVGDEFIVSKERFAEIKEGLKKFEDTTWVEEVKASKK